MPDGGAYLLDLMFSKKYSTGMEVTGFSEKGQTEHKVLAALGFIGPLW